VYTLENTSDGAVLASIVFGDLIDNTLSDVIWYNIIANDETFAMAA